MFGLIENMMWESCKRYRWMYTTTTNQVRVYLKLNGIDIKVMCNALLNVRFKRKIFHRNWPRLFEWWWTLSTGLISIQWIAQFVLWTHIRWIAIYSLDSFIYLLNNWALMFWSGSFRFYCYCQEGKYSEKLVILKLLGILKELSKYL